MKVHLLKYNHGCINITSCGLKYVRGDDYVSSYIREVTCSSCHKTKLFGALVAEWPTITQKDMERLEKSANKIGEMFARYNEGICAICPEQGYLIDRGESHKGCCNYCGSSRGYYKKHTLNIYNSMNLESYYINFEDGYFNSATQRCNLPRHLRSETCLSYFCVHIKRKILNLENFRLSLRHHLNTMRQIKRQYLLPY